MLCLFGTIWLYASCVIGRHHIPLEEAGLPSGVFLHLQLLVEQQMEVLARRTFSQFQVASWRQPFTEQDALATVTHPFPLAQSGIFRIDWIENISTGAQESKNFDKYLYSRKPKDFQRLLYIKREFYLQ